MNALERRAALSLAFVYVMRMLGLFMVIPVIAIAATEFSDYSPLLVGVAIGGYGLTQALLQIPMGMASDKYGRKLVIYLGLCFFILGSLIAANADSMAMLVLGRILQGMGAIAGAVMALAADVTRENQRAKIMAVIGISIGFSFYLALILGPLISSQFGLQGIFLLTAIGALICLPIIKWGVITQAQVPSGDAIPSIHGLKLLSTNTQLMRLNISVLIIHLLITSFFVQVPILLSAMGFELGQHWIIYTPVLFVSVAMMVALMKLNNSVSKTSVIRLSIAFMALAFLVLIAIANQWFELNWGYVLVAGVLFFAGFNYLEANLPAMVSSIAPAGQKGSAMGIYASFQFFGAFAGGLITGMLNQWFEPFYMYVFALATLLTLVLVLSAKSDIQKSKRYTLSLPDNISLTQASVSNFENEIRKIEGVQEIRIESNTRAIYIKTMVTNFDITKVQRIFD